MISFLTSMKDAEIANAHLVLTIGTSNMEITRLPELSTNAPVAEVRRNFKDPAGTMIYPAGVTYGGDAIHIEMKLKP